MSVYYLKRDDGVLGPFSAAELKSLARDGQIGPLDLLSRDQRKWTQAWKVGGLRLAPKQADQVVPSKASPGPIPPPIPPSYSPPPSEADWTQQIMRATSWEDLYEALEDSGLGKDAMTRTEVQLLLLEAVRNIELKLEILIAIYDSETARQNKNLWPSSTTFHRYEQIPEKCRKALNGAFPDFEGDCLLIASSSFRAFHAGFALCRSGALQFDLSKRLSQKLPYSEIGTWHVEHKDQHKIDLGLTGLRQPISTPGLRVGPINLTMKEMADTVDSLNKLVGAWNLFFGRHAIADMWNLALANTYKTYVGVISLDSNKLEKLAHTFFWSSVVTCARRGAAPNGTAELVVSAQKPRMPMIGVKGLDVLVDGVVLGTIQFGESQSFTVSPGGRTVSVAMRCLGNLKNRSQETFVMVAESEPCCFQVSYNRVTGKVLLART